MSSSKPLLAKTKCPECRTGILIPADGLQWRCVSCGEEFPLLEGVPVLFVQADRAEFLKLNAEISSNRSDSNQASYPWALYHWHTYDFASIMPPSSQGKELLVFGCGEGDDRALLEKLGFEVTGFDIYRTPGTDLLCDGHNLPFQDQSFDVVLSSQVFEHLHSPWIAIQEIARVLRPNGVFVGSVAFIKPFHQSYFHITYAGMYSLFEQAGLKMDHAHAAQSVLWSLLLEMLPFRFPRRFRPAIRRTCMWLEDGYWNTRSSFWKLRNRTDPRQVGIRRYRDLPLSYEQGHRLRFAPAVVFRAVKPSIDSVS